MTGALLFLAFAFYFAELIAIGALDKWPVRFAVKILDREGPLLGEATLVASPPSLHGFKVRAISDSEYLLRPVAFHERQPSIDPLVMGIGQLLRNPNEWHLRAYWPVGPWLVSAAFAVFGAEAGVSSGYGVAGWAGMGLFGVAILFSLRHMQRRLRQAFEKLLSSQEGATAA